jgi:hypothetical protein
MKFYNFLRPTGQHFYIVGDDQHTPLRELKHCIINVDLPLRRFKTRWSVNNAGGIGDRGTCSKLVNYGTTFRWKIYVELFHKSLQEFLDDN